MEVVDHLIPYHVQGDVGTAHARTEGHYLLGVFNNLGIIKTTDGEISDPNAEQIAYIRGSCKDVRLLVGSEYVTKLGPSKMELRLPAGEIAVLSFPDDSGNITTNFPVISPEGTNGD
jgi:hypothetical protein